MQQLLQSLADGRVVLQEIPVPSPASGAILVRTSRSLISSGTERMLLEFGRANWIDKIPMTFNGPIWSVSVEVLVYAFFFPLCRF